MSANLLAISNMFAGTSGAGAAPAKPTAIRKNQQFSPPTPDNTPFTKARGTITNDTTQVKSQNRLNDEPPSEFSHTFRKEITTVVPQKGENSKNATKQNLTQNPAEQPSLVQIWLTQYSLNIEHGKEGVARKVEPKAGYELAQLLTSLKPDGFPSPAGKTTQPQTSKPVLIVGQKQVGPKAALPETSKLPVITDTSSNKDENANRIQMPNTSLPATKGSNNEQSGRGLPLEAHIRAQNRITTANGKPEAVPISNALGSLKTPPLVDEGPSPQVLVDNDSELTGVSKKPAIAGKSVVPANQKVPAPNPSLPPVQDKSSGLQPQLVGIGLRKSLLTAEKAVDNKTNPAQQGQILPEASTDDKATAGQPRRPGTPQLTEPLADDDIEQGDNFTGKSLSQKLHNPQLQVSTGQIKDRGSSASNNDSDSGFEQILSGNNTETCIAEQTTVFPEAVKADNMPAQNSPSDVSASITEQILESIQSPSSQQAGTQQITIRLNPPELGKVFIKFEEQENQITGLLEVSKAQTRYEVEQALPQIIQSLADSGIQVKRLEVMLTNQNEQQSYRDELLQDGSFQQYHDLPEGSNPDNHDTVATNESDIFGHDGSYWGNLEPQMQITDNSINILI